jgi:hypothetical protein
VELITDGGRADWLVPRLQPFGTVGGTAGVGFDAYARVLHPVGAFREDPGSVDEHGDPTVLDTGTWRWAAVGQRTGQVVDAGTSWSDVSGSRDDDVLFDDGWRIEPPDQGWFDPQLLSALTTHLASATATPLDLVAAVWEGWGDLTARPRSRSAGRVASRMRPSAPRLGPKRNAWLLRTGRRWHRSAADCADRGSA